MNEFTDEQSAMIQNMGALGYNPQKISNIMNFDVDTVIEWFNNDSSDFKKLYQKGSDYGNYLIDLKLFEMAQSGDIKAIEKLEGRKRAMLVKSTT